MKLFHNQPTVAAAGGSQTRIRLTVERPAVFDQEVRSKIEQMSHQELFV